jgi:hypothetical protein
MHGGERLEQLFDGVDVCLIGAHAVNVYAPERTTQVVDYFTLPENYAAASERLCAAGFVKRATDLEFFQSRLDLFGVSWDHPESKAKVDLLSSTGSWAEAAFAAPRAVNTAGDRVMPLAYLVLMKLDAARSQDQADLTRILGRVASADVDRVVDVIERHYSRDPALVEDVRQYALLGRWEYGLVDPPTEAEDAP